AAHMIDPAAGSATRSGTVSIALPGSEAAARSAPHARAGSLAFGGDAHVGGLRHADVRQAWVVGQSNVLLHVDRSGRRNFGIVELLHLRRRNRVLHDLGQTTLDGVDDAVIAATAASAILLPCRGAKKKTTRCTAMLRPIEIPTAQALRGTFMRSGTSIGLDVTCRGGCLIGKKASRMFS